MFLLFCCAPKGRKDNDGDTIGGYEAKIKNSHRILIEFISEEQKIGLKEIPCLELIEPVMVQTIKNEIPRKELIKIY
jgi:hypothetical protein